MLYFGRKTERKETSRTPRHILDERQYRINRSEVGCKNLGWIRGADEENLGSRKTRDILKSWASKSPTPFPQQCGNCP